MPFKSFATAERFDDETLPEFDENGAIGADGERGAEGLLRLPGPTETTTISVTAPPFSLRRTRFFDGDFVERVHRHFELASSIGPRLSGLHSDLDRVINDALTATRAFMISGSPRHKLC